MDPLGLDSIFNLCGGGVSSVLAGGQFFGEDDPDPLLTTTVDLNSTEELDSLTPITEDRPVSDDDLSLLDNTEEGYTEVVETAGEVVPLTRGYITDTTLASWRKGEEDSQSEPCFPPVHRLKRKREASDTCTTDDESPSKGDNADGPISLPDESTSTSQTSPDMASARKRGKTVPLWPSPRSEQKSSPPRVESCFPCDHCERTFKERRYKYEHEKRVHGTGKCYRCGQTGCFAKFGMKRDLARHLRTVHKGEELVPVSSEHGDDDEGNTDSFVYDENRDVCQLTIDDRVSEIKQERALMVTPTGGDGLVWIEHKP